jgi:hypothetical protein
MKLKSLFPISSLKAETKGIFKMFKQRSWVFTLKAETKKGEFLMFKQRWVFTSSMCPPWCMVENGEPYRL